MVNVSYLHAMEYRVAPDLSFVKYDVSGEIGILEEIFVTAVRRAADVTVVARAAF